MNIKIALLLEVILWSIDEKADVILQKIKVGSEPDKSTHMYIFIVI